MKIINLKIWKDFFDREWRIKVLFWKWEVARFKIDALSMKIERDENI